MLRALEKNGGVIGINFGEGFLNPKDAAGLMQSINNNAAAPQLTGKALDDYAAKEFHDEKPMKVFATLDDAVAHIDHAVKEGRGRGPRGDRSDFDGISGPPNGLED